MSGPSPSSRLINCTRPSSPSRPPLGPTAQADRKRLLISGLEGLAQDEEEARQREIRWNLQGGGGGGGGQHDRRLGPGSRRFARPRGGPGNQGGQRQGQHRAPSLQVSSFREFEPSKNENFGNARRKG